MMAAKRLTHAAIENFRNIDHLALRFHLDGAVPDNRLRTRADDRRTATDPPTGADTLSLRPTDRRDEKPNVTLKATFPSSSITARTICPSIVSKLPV